MQDLVNRIGMTLQFVSLWLVTPQILGEQNMLAAARRLRRIIDASMNKVAELSFNYAANLMEAGGGITGCYLALLCIRWVLFKVFPHAHWIRYLSYVVAIPKLIFLSAVAAVFVAFAAFLLAFVAQKLIERAAGSTRRLLGTGAMVFTIGFAVLMWATWLPH